MNQGKFEPSDFADLSMIPKQQALSDAMNQKTTHKPNWALWAVAIIGVIFGITGLTVAIVKPVLNVPVPFVNVPAEAVKVTADINTTALVGSIEQGTMKIAAAVGTNTDKVSNAAETVGNGNKTAVEALAKTLEDGLKNTKNVLEKTEQTLAAGHAPVQVPTSNPVLAPAPEAGTPTETSGKGWSQTIMSEETLGSNSLGWKIVGNFKFPMAKNKSGKSSPIFGDSAPLWIAKGDWKYLDFTLPNGAVVKAWALPK